MKTPFLFLLALLLASPGFSQNILEALQLQYDWFGGYAPGELGATDTIVDLRNGYYEEYLALEDGNAFILRQAAIFHNSDGTRTLGISKTKYDMVCFFDETEFYEIAPSKDSIYAIPVNHILPDIRVHEFLTDTIFAALHTYFPESHADSEDAIQELISQVYGIEYILPQEGTNLIATLLFCDYYTPDQVSISAEDWSVIEHQFATIELAYDRTQKRFKKITDTIDRQ